MATAITADSRLGGPDVAGLALSHAVPLWYKSTLRKTLPDDTRGSTGLDSTHSVASRAFTFASRDVRPGRSRC